MARKKKPKHSSAARSPARHAQPAQPVAPEISTVQAFEHREPAGGYLLASPGHSTSMQAALQAATDLYVLTCREVIEAHIARVQEALG